MRYTPVRYIDDYEESLLVQDTLAGAFLDWIYRVVQFGLYVAAAFLATGGVFGRP